MNILTLDFETFFSDDYTLKKMTTEAYIRDPRFEALLVGARAPNGQMCWGHAYDLFRWDWSSTAVLCHHAHFDGLILAHHFGIKPAFWFDTLSMARLVHGPAFTPGGSLAALAKHFGLVDKSVPYDLFRGKHWHELSAGEQQALGEGCCHDVELTWTIFQKLLPQVPESELELIDLTVRMFTEPVIEGDVAELELIGAEEEKRKAAAMDELGITAKELGSSDKFATILTGLGVEVEYKDTPKGNSIPAVAKTDDFMKGLLEHEDETIAALASARLDVRSGIDETRSQRLAASARRGKLPVYLAYAAAHTLRWGGGDKVNFQNFRRGGRIRKALMAPEGHLLMVADASQIECRILEYVAEEETALEDFRRGVDPYTSIASQFYGRQITKADKAERGMGKQIRLSCGYGAGGDSIVRTAKRGTYGPPVTLTAAEGLGARDLYRRERPGVVQLWREGDEALRFIGQQWPKGSVDPSAHWLNWRQGVQVYANSDGSGWIEGPTGNRMLYELEWDMELMGWKRKTRKGWSKIWGGHLVENLIQWLARNYVAEIMTDMRDTMPECHLAWMSHDELVYVVRADSWAQSRLDWLLERMRKAPAWLPGIPLDAEGSLSKRYEK